MQSKSKTISAVTRAKGGVKQAQVKPKFTKSLMTGGGKRNMSSVRGPVGRVYDPGTAPLAVSEVLKPSIQMGYDAARATAKVRVPLHRVWINPPGLGESAPQTGCAIDFTPTGLSTHYAAKSEMLSATYSIVMFPQGTGDDSLYRIDLPLSKELLLMGFMFSKYRVKHLKFHYAPACPSTTDGQLVLSFSADPLHPVLSAPEYQLPTFQNLIELSSSVVFAPWQQADLDCTAAMEGQWFYTAQAAMLSDVTYTATQIRTTHTPRFNSYGILGCMTTEAPVSDLSLGVACGYVVLEAEFEFADRVPVLGLNADLQVTVGPARRHPDAVASTRAAIAQLKELDATPLPIAGIIAGIANVLPHVIGATKALFSKEHEEEDVLAQLLPLLQKLVASYKLEGTRK